MQKSREQMTSQRFSRATFATFVHFRQKTEKPPDAAIIENNVIESM